jgi:hypothetical protein
VVKARCGVASIAAGRFIQLAPEPYEKSPALLSFVALRLGNEEVRRIGVAFIESHLGLLLSFTSRPNEPSLVRCTERRIQPSW